MPDTPPLRPAPPRTPAEESDEARPLLGRLDDAVVPRLQRAVRAPGTGLRSLDRGIGDGQFALFMTRHRAFASLVIAGLLFGATAVHAQRFPELQEQQRLAANQTPTSGGSEADDPTLPSRPVTAVGPLDGAQVAPYLAERQVIVDALAPDDEVVAVVSFGDYLDPNEVALLLPDGLVVHEAQFQLPERDPVPGTVEVADGDLAGAVGRHIDLLIAQLRSEEGEVQSLLDSGVESEDFRADYEARVDELRTTRNLLASGGEILFAVVVSGTAADLRELADEEAVRFVDATTGTVDVDTATFYGILPTDRERFSYGRPV